jgi:hypothetical protein
MTTRVFDFPHPALELAEPAPVRTRRASAKTALVVGSFLVPVAGAAERPQGWWFSAGVAVIILGAAVFSSRRLPWGWLASLSALAGIVAPRPGNLTVIGPVLFVATGLCFVLWWTSLSEPPRPRRRALAGAIDSRSAQFSMGLSGERHVGRRLASELPQGYVLINGAQLPGGAGDVDHLVIGPTGIFLLETKTMAGHIVCQPDGTWSRTRVGRAGTPYAAYIGDPAAQVHRNILAARECLKRGLPWLFEGTPLWIEGLVVFAHPRTQLEAQHSRVPAVLLEEVIPRICQHAPRRRLQPVEIEAIADLLVSRARSNHPGVVRQSAQALVEVALCLPVLLALVVGTVAVSRLVQTQGAIVAVAEDAARAGALGRNPRQAAERVVQRARAVAAGLGLDPRRAQLQWDVSKFDANPGEVRVSARYAIDLGDLPLAGWIGPVSVGAEHVELVDPFRSGVGGSQVVGE